VVRAKGGAAKAPAVVPGEPRYSFTFLNTPFWEVMDEVCRSTHLTIQPWGGEDTVGLYHGNGQPPFVGRDGAFRYTATNMQLYRNVDLSAAGAANRHETLTFNFTLFAEPRLPFLGQQGDLRVEAAYDSERNSMLMPSSTDPNHFEGGPWGGVRVSRRYYNGGYKQMQLGVALQLNRVSEKATSLKLLKGVVPVSLLVETKPIILADKVLSAKGKKTTVGDIEFHIENVQKQANNRIEIKFTATNKAVGNDYNWINTLQQRLELHDDKGNKFQNWGTNWHGGGANNMSMTQTFMANGPNKIGEPAKFVYQHWITRQHDIHFEFRDVPLP
jgi:hypothetical protein